MGHRALRRIARISATICAPITTPSSGEQPLDWPASWQVQRVGAAEWEALRSQLRLEYDELRASLNTLPAWSDAAVADSLAIVAHTAYHLGAIRQIRRSLQVQTRHFIAAPETPPN